MRVANLMVTDLKVVEGDVTVADAVLVMSDAHISALPVVDPAGRIVGVLSTTDILGAAAECASAAERDGLFEETLVEDLMTKKPATVSVDVDVKEAAQQMLYLEIHRLFVLERGQLVGVISQSDIVRGVATAQL
ncbi:MAG TPA: CBS domain-containing protein [Gemmatimonadales bacterium]